MTSTMLPAYLDLEELDRLITMWLAEDVGDGDVTTRATIPDAMQARGRFVAKQAGVAAGLLVADRVFAALPGLVSVDWAVSDGSPVEAGFVLGRIHGDAGSMLTGERLALNLLQRMSGIATATARMARLARPARILDTRKTVPGLRALDKWAVLLGGGQNHRIGLYDMVLIKDNHIEAAGGIASAVERARAFMANSGRPLPIEVEARTLEEVDQVLAVPGVDWVLLDNMVRTVAGGLFDVSMLAEAVRRIGGRVRTEASGNVTEASVSAIAAAGVDAISSGALTHSVRALDISLEFG